jgi:xylulokinase
MIATGLLGSGSSRGRGNVAQTPPPNLPGRSSSVTSSLGLPFDPYDYTPLPARVLATGAATNFPSVANLVGDVFNAPVFVPTTQVDSAQVVPHRNAPASGFPGRAALGGAYIARWVWGKERGSSPGGSGAGRGLGGFEDEMRRLLGKRWVATGALPLRTNVNGASPSVGASAGAGGAGGGSGANSGASTPYGHGPSRSGLGSTVFVEEDEDEVEEMERNGSGNGVVSPSAGGGFGFGEIGDNALRMRTQTSSTVDSGSSSFALGGGSTAFTTPDLNTGLGSPDPNAGGPATPTTTTTALTPVTAMPTADAEAQIGLAKVAEPDVDAFMTYAAIVPEYCRLESMLVKSLV